MFFPVPFISKVTKKYDIPSLCLLYRTRMFLYILADGIVVDIWCIYVKVNTSVDKFFLYSYHW